ERVPQACELLSKMMRPALRQDDFDREKGVILEEIAMYKDEPFWVLFEEVMQRHYGAHRMGHRVLGTNETIKALTSGAMRSYCDERYSADNTVVAMAGRVDFDAAAAQISEVCATWTPTRVTRDAARPSVGAGDFTMRK